MEDGCLDHPGASTATLATLLRQADVRSRLPDPLETADIWPLSHFTNNSLLLTYLNFI